LRDAIRQSHWDVLAFGDKLDWLAKPMRLNDNVPKRTPLQFGA
jgi:hypothetical protein